jgi:hypothetical protein
VLFRTIDSPARASSTPDAVATAMHSRITNRWWRTTGPL